MAQAAPRKAPVDDAWRIPDALWTLVAPLLPPRKAHPLGCHNPRVDDRRAMDAIFFVLRTGCQWNALNATGLCTSSSAHRRFQEWAKAGVFRELWRLGLLACDELEGIDWEWLCIDGAMTKVPLGGKKTGPNPTDRGKSGTKRSLLTDGGGIPVGLVVAGANEHDKWLAGPTLLSQPVLARSPRKVGRSTSAPTRATTTPTCARWPSSGASPPTSRRGARRKRSGPRFPAIGRAVGSWSGRIAG